MNNTNKLVRPRTGKVIAGVCAGIAQHFNISESLVRVAFLLATFFGTIGFIAYLICWIVIPQDPKQ